MPMQLKARPIWTHHDKTFSYLSMTLSANSAAISSAVYCSWWKSHPRSLACSLHPSQNSAPLGVGPTLVLCLREDARSEATEAQ